MKKVLITLWLAFICMVIGAELFAQQDQSITIASGGIQRTFQVHLPSAAPAAGLPVLLCYHGTGGTGTSMNGITGFNALANQYNFIVAYPQAVVIGSDVQWNVYVDDKPGHAGVGVADAPDDVQFTRDMIGKLSAAFGADPAKVFATGLSNGGFMCYALSMLASADIKAIAPVAASMWGESNYINQLAVMPSVKTMPVMHVHGTSDNTVDYPDPDNTPKDYEEYPLFVSARGCNALTYSQVVPVMKNVDKLVFCTGPVEVSLIRITGMAHAWTNGTYQTSLEIVKFFGLDKSSSGVRPDHGPRFSIVPNPANTQLRIELTEPATIQLINTMGITVHTAAHPAGPVTVPCGDLPAGIYGIRILSLKDRGAVTEYVVVRH